MFDFTGKTVMITGASYGLGEAFARAFAAAGADLVLTARSEDLLEAVGDACRAEGREVTTAVGDVSVEANARAHYAGMKAKADADSSESDWAVYDRAVISAP